MESKNTATENTMNDTQCDAAHGLELAAVDANRDGDHERVVALVEEALALRPNRLRLYMILESAYFHLGRLAEAAAVQERVLDLMETGKADRGNSIQAKLDEMHWLVNVAFGEFARGNSIAGIVDDVGRAAVLERELLAHWSSESLNGRDLPPGRGELTASAAYLTALRQAGRFREAADWFRLITEDTYVFSQCVRDFRVSAENTLNNGIGALLDTRDQDDLVYGGTILALVDSLKGFETPLLPLACASLAAQRGELERALDYLNHAMDHAEEEILSDAGSDLRTLAWTDPDLAPIRDTEEFLQLVGTRQLS